MFNNSMTVSETDMEDELLQKLNNKHGMIEDDYEQPQCKDEKDQMGRNKICYVRLNGGGGMVEVG